MSSFSDRLREERNRLELNQPDFGLIGGVGKQSQINYESGKRFPDADYLMSIASTGADLLYILTGQRGSSTVPLPLAGELPSHLRARLKDAIEAVEAGLEALDRSASPEVKAELVLAAYDLLAQQGENATAQIIRLVKTA